MSQAYGLYVHVPFCSSKCRYCDFHSKSEAPAAITPVLSAIAAEHRLIRFKYELATHPIRSIYFGGGTPSLIDEQAWPAFVADIFKSVIIIDDAEFTIECNPDSFSTNKAKAWLSSGVNRLSIGIQSLNEKELRILGRSHSAQQSKSLLSDPNLSLFRSVGADIIWGLPGQTTETLKATLNGILETPHIDHISAYELTIADNTPFGRHRSLLQLPDEDSMLRLSELLHTELKRAGFKQYEISNWAKGGAESVHNSCYWQHLPYIGIGPSAHSFMNGRRWANIEDHSQYAAAIAAHDQPTSFIETLTSEDIGREMVLLGLRTNRGLNFEAYMLMTGHSFLSKDRQAIVNNLTHSGFASLEENRMILTESGLDRADGIAALLA